MKVSDIFVTTILVADEHAKKIDTKIKDLSRTLRPRYSNYEILIIDNGLSYEELVKARKLLPKVACVRIVQLSRHHDTDTAIFAGVEASIGDYVCIVYGEDPIQLIPKFIEKTRKNDIVFGIAKNLKRATLLEDVGARIFYWYSKRFLNIDIPSGSTYYICMNRSVANAMTKSGRFMRHIRHMAKRIGFNSSNLDYVLPAEGQRYSKVQFGTLLSRAIDLISNYSSHPLRLITYFGILAGILNVVYAFYVLVINLSQQNVMRGWTSLSLQSSFMFFILFIILAVLAEYVGKILNETQQEPPYHIMQEHSSTISIADETRRNVTE